MFLLGTWTHYKAKQRNWYIWRILLRCGQQFSAWYSIREDHQCFSVLTLYSNVSTCITILEIPMKLNELRHISRGILMGLESWPLPTVTLSFKDPVRTPAWTHTYGMSVSFKTHYSDSNCSTTASCCSQMRFYRKSEQTRNDAKTRFSFGVSWI